MKHLLSITISENIHNQTEARNDNNLQALKMHGLHVKHRVLKLEKE